MENKESFNARLKPFFPLSEELDIKLAYYLAKYGHRAQVRKEMQDGEPMRYFEHVRRVAIILMDEAKIMRKEMIITALLHDSIEDTEDLTPELLEHSFGPDVVSLIKILSKVPKDGYIERLAMSTDWRALLIKGCDRLDNMRSLMLPENTMDFKKKQIAETKDKYFPLFDRMVTLTPSQHATSVSLIRDEVRRIVERCSTIMEIEEKGFKYCSKCCGACIPQKHAGWNPITDF